MSGNELIIKGFEGFGCAETFTSSIPLRRARSTFDQPLCFSFIGTCVWVRVWVWVRVRVWVWVCGSGASAGVLKPRRSGTVWQVQIGPVAFLALATHTHRANNKTWGLTYLPS